jgi:signal transduction histidine kinase
LALEGQDVQGKLPLVEQEEEMPSVEIREHDLNLLLASFNEGVCCLDARGELRCSNETARTHWNLDPLLTSRLFAQLPIARAQAGEVIYRRLVHVSEQQSLLVSIIPLCAGTNTSTGVVIISQEASDHVQAQRQAQGALNVLFEAILNSHDIEDIDHALRRVAGLIPQLAGVDNSIALRFDSDTGRLAPLAFFGSGEQSDKEWLAELAAMEFGAEKAIIDTSPAYLQALRLGRPIMFDSTLTPIYGNPRKLHAAIYAPVFFHGQVVGLLGAERHRPLEERADTYFPQWSVDMLAALARLASMAIEKAALLAAMERLRDDVTAAQRLLGQREEFLLLTAHELKSPLTAIRGHAQILRRRLDRLGTAPNMGRPEDLVRGLDSIEHQTRRVEQVTNTLLEASRVDLDRLELNFKDVDLIQLARRTLEEYLPFAEDHELRLVIDGQTAAITGDEHLVGAPIIVRGDEQRLEQVLTNLISNAIKYSPEGGPVIVSLRCAGDGYVELAVEDRGIGIPPDEQAHLTERFYRASNAQLGSTQGLGLGLYLVNALVARHGGTLSIQSEGIPGKGSVFTIRLPASSQETSES